MIGAVTEEAKRFSLTQERDGWVHSSKSTGPYSGTDVGGETARRRDGETAKLLFVIEQGKPLKFGLRTADNLQIFNKFHRSTRVCTDQDQHKSSVCIHPLLKGIDHSTMVIGDARSLGTSPQAETEGTGPGVS